MQKDWKSILTEEEFFVCREKGTEPAFSGNYDKFYEDGIYLCKCCKNQLFSSKEKFNSGSGWPSTPWPTRTSLLKSRSSNSLISKPFLSSSTPQCSPPSQKSLTALFLSARSQTLSVHGIGSLSRRELCSRPSTVRMASSTSSKLDTLSKVSCNSLASTTFQLSVRWLL